MRRFKHRWWSWYDVAIMVAILGTMAIGIVFGVRECNARESCRSKGGRVHEYDCRYTLVGKTIVRTCEWTCQYAEQP